MYQLNQWEPRGVTLEASGIFQKIDMNVCVYLKVYEVTFFRPDGAA